MIDILTRCTGSIAAEVVKCTAKPVIRHVGYLFRFKKIVNDLIKAKTDLQLEQQKVQEAIERAAMNNEIAEKDVERWLTDVNQLMEEVQALEIKVQVNLRFCNGWCPDWIRQYKLCKEAIQKTNVVKVLQDKGKFPELAHRVPTPGIEIFSSSDFKVFESRKLAFQHIMEALHDDNSKRIGLHGMGGIGKTTLVKEVYKKVKELNIFNDIVMIAVSRTPDVRRIQGEIADCLHLKFEEESDTFRANRICSRIKSVEKILIIVDDVWDSVELKDFGIPSPDDHKGCRILLTTRSEHVCHLMFCHQRMISLNFLLEKESLALMKSIVGDYTDLNDVMLKVVEECKGLPIAISTVGKALKGKTRNEWNVAIYELRRSRLVDIEGVNEEKNAYVCIKWSYDQLKYKTKLCFLLCSLFPEDYCIPIEELTRYVMVLEKYEDDDLLETRRSHVLAAIHNLKDSSLLQVLLDYFGSEYVKMHDMVRDVGLWIASEGKNEFGLRACTCLDKNINFEQVTAISLIDYKTKQLPDKWVCPRLNILLLGGIQSSKEISTTFLEGMNCLKVLALHDKILSSQSLELLTNLQTLYLKRCNFSDDLSSLRKLKRLETLSFYRCDLVALPSELGEMASLKMLDLTHCCELKQIPPNVIGRLSQLEELIIKGSFENWDVEGTTSEISNANLSELNSLPRLVNLSLELNSMHLPKGFVFPDLQRYCILINTLHRTLLTPHYHSSLRCINSRTLKIRDLNASSMNAFKSLFHTVEYIWIESCEMECIVDTIGGNHAATFGNLVELYLEEMSCLRTICQGPNQYEIFSNLTALAASGCPRLISLFSPSLAQSLKKLKHLSLHGCDEMKQIISEGMILESHGQPICLSKLETLEVGNCGKLEYIFPISVAQGLQQLERLELHDLPRLKKVFGQNREGEGGDCEIESHHQPTGFPKLKTLWVTDCGELEYIFPISIARGLQQLESLALRDLPLLKKVFGQNREGEVGDCEIESHHQPTGFPKLKTLKVTYCGELEYIFPISAAPSLQQLESLELEKLPRLKKVYGQNREGDGGDCEIESQHQPTGFPKLKTLQVTNCGELEYIFPISAAPGLQQLESLELKNLPRLKKVFGQNREGDVGDCEIESHHQPTGFPKLKTIGVVNCDNLEYIFPISVARDLPQLESLELKNLPQLKQVFGHEEGGDGGDGKNSVLPELVRFTRSSVWPSLERLYVVNCPKVKLSFFANVEANVPALQKLQNLQILPVDDWNAISFDLMQGLSNLEELYIKNCGGIHEVIKLEGLLTIKGEQQDLLLPRLKNMLLTDLHELRCIWKGATKLINPNNLENLKVIRCKKLTHLFTPVLVQSLQKLKVLEIARCDELEHLIVENVEEGVSSECHLQPLCFPKLERVNVRYCNKLKSLFPMTIADSLLELQSFLVKENPQLMEVFTHEGDAGVQKDVTLPQLQFMGLKGLPSLVDFCPKNYQFILPKWSQLKVYSCKKMRTTFTHTPDRSVLINGEVAQIDEPTGISTISQVLTICPVNNDITWRTDVKDDDEEFEDDAYDSEDDELDYDSEVEELA